MPRKFQQKSLRTKPTADAHSSLASRREARTSETETGKDDSEQATVNDLIQRLRRSQTGERPRSPIYTPVQGAIHPSLRAILGMPENVAPNARPNLHAAGPLRTRRIPGPPPPPSWLTQSHHAPKHLRYRVGGRSNPKYRIYCQPSKLPGAFYSGHSTLRHIALKSIATHWNWHCEYDAAYLQCLPVSLKEVLLSYIAVYSDSPKNPLDQLFLQMSEENATGDDAEVRRLDLGNAIGSWISIKQLAKKLVKPKTRSQCSLDPSLHSPAQDSTRATIPESWDDSQDGESRDDGFEQSWPATINVLGSPLRFSALRHLSLALSPAHPTSVVSWPALLSISPHLAALTSLSLAFWPAPTYTPNAGAVRATLQGSSLKSLPAVAYSASDMYTVLDGDWEEASAILRTLSRQLYCLTWLDLTGCADWFPALTWDAPAGNNVELTDGNTPKLGRIGPEWNGSWRGIEYLGLGVGWLPADRELPLDRREAGSPNRLTAVIEAVPGPSATETRGSLARLSLERRPQEGSMQITEDPAESWNVEEEREKHRLRQEWREYSRLWYGAQNVAQMLRAIRRAGRGKLVEFGDFGSPPR